MKDLPSNFHQISSEKEPNQSSQSFHDGETPEARVQREKDAKAGRLDEVKLVMAQERQAEEEYRQQVGSVCCLFFQTHRGGMDSWREQNKRKRQQQQQQPPPL